MGYPLRRMSGAFRVLPRYGHIPQHIEPMGLLPIGRVTMAKRKVKPSFAVCGECMERIDLQELLTYAAKGWTYQHSCGRVLVRVR